jgi:hypothetical protein
MLGKLFERALVGAVLGAGIGSGAGSRVVPALVDQLSQSIAKSSKAIEFVAQAMHQAEMKADNWSSLSSFQKDVWLSRAVVAIKSFSKLLTQSLAGRIKK